MLWWWRWMGGLQQFSSSGPIACKNPQPRGVVAINSLFDLYPYTLFVESPDLLWYSDTLLGLSLQLFGRYLIIWITCNYCNSFWFRLNNGGSLWRGIVLRLQFYSDDFLGGLITQNFWIKVVFCNSLQCSCTYGRLDASGSIRLKQWTYG